MNCEKLIHNPESISTTDLIEFITKANDIYFNDDTDKSNKVNDHIYDLAIELLEDRDPNNTLLSQIGTPILKDKVKLPFHMGSMNKLKTPDKINAWLKKYDDDSYIITDKLDGISALLVINTNNIKLYSRGNGTVGQDISHLLPMINLPNFNGGIDAVFRGELIVSNKYFNENAGTNYVSARSLINSLVATKKTSNFKIQFIVFDFVSLKASIENQLIEAKKLGMDVVHYIKKDRNALKNLKEILLERKDASKYNIDGIIVNSNKIHDKNTEGNPKYSFAFKSNGLGEITKVTKVEWNISKHGKIVPRIFFNQVLLNNSKVSCATGIHAQYIKDHNIDIGATIRVVLSGDVIPKIVDIIIPAKSHSLPTIPYKWNSVNIYIENSDEINPTFRLNHFFGSLGIKGCSKGTIERLVINGYNTIDKFKSISVSDLLKLKGFQQKSSETLVVSLRDVFESTYTNALLAYSSLCFGEGIGYKKMLSIETTYPLFHTHDLTVEKLNSIEGFSTKTSEKIINKIEDYRNFLKKHSYLKIENPINKNKSKSIKNYYTFTGFRNQNLKEKLENDGNKVEDTITKNTNYLVIAGSSRSSKVKKAESLGITIISADTLISKYIL